MREAVIARELGPGEVQQLRRGKLFLLIRPNHSINPKKSLNIVFFGSYGNFVGPEERKKMANLVKEPDISQQNGVMAKAIFKT